MKIPTRPPQTTCLTFEEDFSMRLAYKDSSQKVDDTGKDGQQPKGPSPVETTRQEASEDGTKDLQGNSVYCCRTRVRIPKSQ